MWEQTLDAFPCAEIELLKPPATAIEFVTYRDLDAVTQVLPNTRYTLDAATFPGWLLPEIDAGWPVTDGSANCITIRYTTGYADADSIPADMRAWLLLTAAFLFAQREAMVLDGKVSEIRPASSTRCSTRTACSRSDRCRPASSTSASPSTPRSP